MRFVLSLGVVLSSVVGVWAQPKENPEALAARAKEIFRAHCFECHGGNKKQGGVTILDRELLVKKEKLVPGKPDDSYLVQLLTATDDSVMPPTGQAKLSEHEVTSIRKWIAAGAPDFPKDVVAPKAEKKDDLKDANTEYVLGKILAHVRTLKLEQRRYNRYFSINHLLAAGATSDELDLHREAFAKAINHLSWERDLVKPQAIDAPLNTVYAIDIRQLGWHTTPYAIIEHGRNAGASKVNLYDLALLEYPYAVLLKDSEMFDRLTEEYLAAAEMLRPIPFVRIDWFVSVVTLPNLYEDMLQLPFTLPELEAKLGVDPQKNLADGTAKRAGMTVSGVSRNNRVVERHLSKYGFYWKSFDFQSNRGVENMFKDPLYFKESGGEMIFALPNGLQAYYVADAKGTRIEAAPTNIVVDKFADDKTVRNGLSCIRCHDSGMKTFTDTVRPALEKLPGIAPFDKSAALKLYVPQKEMDADVKNDMTQFLGAMTKVLGKPQTREPLIPVARRYLENPLPLSAVVGELGLAEASHLQALFRTPAFTSLGLLPLATDGGVIRRDAWEEYYDQAVRGLGIGIPVAPLDGTIRRDFPVANPPFTVELKTNKKNNIFAPGDELRISVTNTAKVPLFVELVGTSATGKKVVLVPATTKLEPGKTLTFPDTSAAAIPIRGGLGKEQITLYASDVAFHGGQVLRGKDVSDRFVHAFQKLERVDGKLTVTGDPSRVVKKTLEIETK